MAQVNIILTMKHYLKILVNDMMYSLSLFSLLLMHIYFLMAKKCTFTTCVVVT